MTTQYGPDDFDLPRVLWTLRKAGDTQSAELRDFGQHCLSKMGHRNLLVTTRYPTDRAPSRGASAAPAASLKRHWLPIGTGIRFVPWRLVAISRDATVEAFRAR
jgi:hypothetical protein